MSFHPYINLIGGKVLNRKETINLTYRKLLKMLSKDHNLNEWERGFMSNVLSKEFLTFSDKQKDKLITMVDKSRIGAYNKVLLKLYIRYVK